MMLTHLATPQDYLHGLSNYSILPVLSSICVNPLYQTCTRISIIYDLQTFTTALRSCTKISINLIIPLDVTTCQQNYLFIFTLGRLG